MQEARFVIDEVLAKGNTYEHRQMNYNNDPKTTFADVQKFFRLLEERIQKRLRSKSGADKQLWSDRPETAVDLMAALALPCYMA